MKKYKLGFEIGALLLFIVLMIPNGIWFLVPAPNDVLRIDSLTPAFDIVASISQVIFILSLCFVVRKNCPPIKFTSYFMILVILSCCLYYFSWIVYYIGLVNPLVILGLTLSPCMAFLFQALDRKNNLAVIPILIFTLCHIVYGFVNFIL